MVGLNVLQIHMVKNLCRPITLMVVMVVAVVVKTHMAEKKPSLNNVLSSIDVL